MHRGRLLLGSIIFFSVLSGCSSLEDKAKVICKQAVLERLRSPTSASFPSDKNITLYKDGAFIVAETLANFYKRQPLPIIEAFNKQAGYFLTVKELDQAGRFSRLVEWDRLGGVLSRALERHFKQSSHQLVGNVDSQNGFGAMLRTQFVCMITFIPDDGSTQTGHWQFIDLMFAN